MRALAAPLTALLLVACGDATGILVDVTSTDLAVPTDINVLRFQATSDTGTSVDRSFALEGGWPQSLTIAPASEADREVTITVSGIRDGSMVIRRVVRVGFERGVTRRVEVVLSRDCVGVACAPGIDCQAGRCVDVPPPMMDAGVDAGGVDAGPGVDSGPEPDGGPDPMDAGPRDGGPTPMDAGPADAGPGDAGVDAFVPPVDAGPSTPVCVTTPAACTGVLVISELSTGGPSGATDEFVELYNRGSETIDASGVVVLYQATTSSSAATRATLPAGALIPAGGYYLVASSGFSGTGADPGGGWSTGFASNRGAVLLEAGSTTLDAVGWLTNADTVAAEGTPIDMAISGTESYERKANASSTTASMTSGADVSAGNGYDSGDNLADFVIRATREPQGSASGTEP